MPIKISPDKQKQLEDNANKMADAGSSHDEIMEMSKQFIAQFGEDDTLKKKASTEPLPSGIAAPSSGLPATVQGASDSALKSPFPSSSESVSGTNKFIASPVKKIVQASNFIDHDIAVKQGFSIAGVDEMQRQQQQNDNPYSLTSVANINKQKQLLNPTFDEQTAAQKHQIFTDPTKLKDYRTIRQTEIDDEIGDYKKQQQAMVGDGSVTTNRAALANMDSPEYKELQARIAESEKYKNELKQSVAQVASVSVPAKAVESGLPIDVKDIGKQVLDIMGQSQKDDDKVLNELAQPNIENVNTRFGVQQQEKYDVKDIDKTQQFINFNREQVGTDAMANYWDYNRKQAYNGNPEGVGEFQSLTEQLKTEKNQGNIAKITERIGQLLQDPIVKKYAQADAEANRYSNISSNVINNYPQVKRNQMRQLVNDAYYDFSQAKDSADAEADPMASTGVLDWIFGKTADAKDAKEIAKHIKSQVGGKDVTEQDVADTINSGDSRWTGATPYPVKVNGLVQGLYMGANDMLTNSLMGTRRFCDVNSVETKNRITQNNLNEKDISAQKSKLIDDFGKYNFNPFSIFNTMGSGISQSAILAAPTLGLGSLAAEGTMAAKFIDGAATVASGYVSSYEDGYKQAAAATDDEKTRRGFANYYALVNALPELYLSPAEIIKKISGKTGAETLFKAFMKEGDGIAKQSLRKVALGAVKEGVNVIAAEEGEELSTTLAEAYGKDKYLGIKTTMPELITQLQQTAIVTAINTLPLAVGAGLHGNVDASSIKKEALFEVGNEPELYKQKLEKPLAEGKISQQEYNNAAVKINTMADIVAGVNTVTKNNGKPLSYDEKVDMAGQQYRILVNKQLEEKTTIDAQRKQAEMDTADAMKKQEAILNKEDPYYAIEEEGGTKKEISREDAIGMLERKETNKVIINNDKELQDRYAAAGATNVKTEDTAPQENPRANFIGKDNNYLANKEEDFFNPEQRSQYNELMKTPATEEQANKMVVDRKAELVEEVAKPKEEEKVADVAKEDVHDEPVTIAEMIDKKGSYQNQRGTFVQDGQRVEFHTDKGNRIYDIGNVDEIKEHPIVDYGIEQEQAVVKLNDDGTVESKGNNYTNPFADEPLKAIQRNKDGNITGVKMLNENGKSVTFRGQRADDLAYQLTLKDITKNEQSKSDFEQFINNDEPTAEAINNAGVPSIANEEANGNNEQVPKPKIERKKRAVKPKEESSDIDISSEESISNVLKKQWDAVNSSEILDNEGNPIQGANNGIASNGLQTLTDKEWGHGSDRLTAKDSLKALQKIMAGDKFEGWFGRIKNPAGGMNVRDYGAKFVVTTDNPESIHGNAATGTKGEGKLNPKQVEIILNDQLSPFGQTLKNKFPDFVIKDYNGKEFKPEISNNNAEQKTDSENKQGNKPTEEESGTNEKPNEDKQQPEGEEGNSSQYSDEVKKLVPQIRKDEVLYADVIKNRSQDFIDELNKQLKRKSKFNIDEDGFKSSVKRMKGLGLSKEEIIAHLDTTNTPTKRILNLIDEVFGNDAINDAAIADLKKSFDDIAKGEKPKKVLQRLANSDITHLVTALKDSLTYNAVSNKQLSDIADQIISTIDINDARKVLAELSIAGMADVKQILRAKLIVELDKIGNVELARRLTKDMADEAVLSGRQTQSLSEAYKILGTKGSPAMQTAYQTEFIEKANMLAEIKNKMLLELLGAKENEIEKLNEKIHEEVQKGNWVDKIKDIIGKICGNRNKKS